MEVAHVDVATTRSTIDAARAPPTGTGWRYLLAPGWMRALWMTALFFGLGFGLVVLHPLVGRLAPDLRLAARSSSSRS